jgi:transposase InsO family protein
MARRPFPEKAKPTENVLDCVTSDVCGPFEIESVGKKLYFITFNDIYSGYTNVEFLRRKSEVPDKAIAFIENLKTQLNQKPKIFRSDRAGEYLSDKMQSYLAKEGIRFQCTVGYAPEQNGIAERKNRTLVEAARTMLIDSGLPKSFWAEAINTAAYVYNNTLNSKTMKTPNENRRLKHFTNLAVQLTS